MLRAQNLLQSISGTGIVPRLLQHDVSGFLIDIESGIQFRQWITRRSQRSSNFSERRLRIQLWFVGVAEVDSREDGQWWWILGVHGIDPFCGIGDEGLPFAGVCDGADKSID